MPPRLDWYDGWMCVLETMADHFEPRYVTSWYPLVPMGENYFRREYAGHEVVGDGLPGYYRIDEAGTKSYSGTWRRFVLPDGGKTMPLQTTFAPIPKPRVHPNTELEYRVGSWWKRTRRTGWVRC